MILRDSPTTKLKQEKKFVRHVSLKRKKLALYEIFNERKSEPQLDKLYLIFFPKAKPHLSTTLLLSKLCCVYKQKIRSKTEQR